MTPAQIPAQPWFDVQMTKWVDQMIGPSQPIEVTDATLTSLGEADLNDMIELVEITKPGPFRQSTHRLERFVGKRDHGRLMAMSGEGMHCTG